MVQSLTRVGCAIAAVSRCGCDGERQHAQEGDQGACGSHGDWGGGGWEPDQAAGARDGSDGLRMTGH